MPLPSEHKDVTQKPFVMEGVQKLNGNLSKGEGANSGGNRMVSEDEYRLLTIIKAAEESGRVVVNYPPDGVVKGWVLIFNGESVAKEVRCSIKDLPPSSE